MSKLKQALELRKQTSKSSTAKLDSLLLRTSDDGRLRQGYKYYGAHTGRWAGEGAQPQNMPRGTVKEEDFDTVVNAIRGGSDFSSYGKTLELVSSTLRAGFRAPEGKTFIIVDLSQIELRVLAWLAHCSGMLSTFAAGGDIYIEFAKSMYKIDEVSKHQRQIAKSAVLGCGFQLSGGKEQENDDGDIVKTGLWGYAANMGIDMTQEEAHEAVRFFRQEYWEVKKFWYKIEDAAKLALQMGGPIPCGPVSCGAVPDRLMWIDIPAGRRLFYPRAKLRETTWPDGGPKTEIRYWAVDPITKKFTHRPTYGGKLTENLCQAIARDVLAEGLLRIDALGFEIVGHSHDEIIVLEDKSKAQSTLMSVESAMTEPMLWAPELQLAAKGDVSDVYRK
jgi:DNA polymerase